MSYRTHVVRVPTECCFKQAGLKYVDASLKSPPYHQFCCPMSLIISTSSFANIPVSLRFLSKFDIFPFWPPAILKNHLVPVLCCLVKTSWNLKNDWVRSAWALARRSVPLTNCRAQKTIAQKLFFKFVFGWQQQKALFSAPTERNLAIANFKPLHDDLP